MIEAERQGYSVDKKFVAETADRTLGSREKMIASRILPDPKGKPDTRPGSNMGIVFVAIAGGELPSLSEGQKQSLKLIAAEIPKKQEKNGSWKSVDDRIPIHESPAIDTAWSIMAMEAGTDASKPSPERDAIAKAKAWLDGQTPTSLQTKVFKIWMALREKKTRAELQPSLNACCSLCSNPMAAGGRSPRRQAMRTPPVRHFTSFASPASRPTNLKSSGGSTS